MSMVYGVFSPLYYLRYISMLILLGPISQFISKKKKKKREKDKYYVAWISIRRLLYIDTDKTVDNSNANLGHLCSKDFRAC